MTIKIMRKNSSPSAWELREKPSDMIIIQG